MDSLALVRRTDIRLTRSPIAIQSLRESIVDSDVGAHAWFEGVTRRMTGGRETLELCYEAFEPMALAEMRRIADEVSSRLDLTAVVMVHRIGVVPVGEASLVIGCSAPHRTAVFEALPTIVNRLKSDVPIWKREQYADGSTEWVHPS